MSGLLGNYQLGADQGNRVKYSHQDWEPATSDVPVASDEFLKSLRMYSQGYAINCHELPEAMAVWDEKRFKKAGEIFSIGFYVVRRKLADVFSRFDLGEGGLIPFTVYRADLETLYPGEFFLLNFGCVKNTILPDRCENATKFLVRKATGVQVWHINDFKPDGEVVLSRQALVGPDLWFEESAHSKIFMSDALAQALIDVGMGDVFRLRRCRIAGGAA